MISLTADNTRLLRDVSMFIEPVEVYDDSGKLLGLFVPANLERGKEVYAKAAAKIDRTELAHRKQSKETGATLEEIWDRVRTFEAEQERRKAAGEPELNRDEAMRYYQSLREQRPNQ